MLYPTSFRIVLREKKNEGKDFFEAILLEGETHNVLQAGLPGIHIHEALFNLLSATSKEISNFLQGRADKELERAGKEPGKKDLPSRH